MSNDFSEYIENLEKENDRLRDALIRVSHQLEKNWGESITLGLVPELHFRIPPGGIINTHMPFTRRKFKSLRLVREFILSKPSDKDIYLKTFGRDDPTIYKEVSILDSDGDPITFYTIEFCFWVKGGLNVGSN